MRIIRSWTGRLPNALLECIPEGRAIPEHSWKIRHRGILILVWCHAVALSAFGIYQGFGVLRASAKAG
jgi:hypothetical protein